MTQSFTITLSSNASLDVYPSNTLASFRTCLPTSIELDGTWEVAITEIAYPRKIYNVRDSFFDFYWEVGGRRWIKNCKVSRGVYDDVEQIIGEIYKGIHHARGVWNKEKLKTYFSWKIDADNKFVLNYPETVKFANMSPDLFHILGCQRVRSTWKNPPLFHDMPSYFPVYIHHWHQVYVYGDFIEQQFVGNSRAPLLTTFPLFDPQQMPPRDFEEKAGGSFGYGVCSFKSFSTPIFKNVSKKMITDLLIELRTDTGDLIPFVGVGRTTLTLLLRKKDRFNPVLANMAYVISLFSLFHFLFESHVFLSQ